MFTIFLLVALIFLVFTFIVVRQVSSAEERRLRLLAGFANRVEATLEDLGSRFARIATERCAGEVETYLGLIPNVEDSTSVAATTGCDDPPGPSDAPPGSLWLVSRGTRLELYYEQEDFVPFPGDPEAAGDRSVGRAVARIDLRDVVGSRIIPDIFDTILLADASGNVVLQQGAPELETRHLEALLGLPPPAGEDEDELDRLIGRALGEAVPDAGAEGDGGDAARTLLPPGAGDATAVTELQIADTRYKVFVQPVTIRPEIRPGRPLEEPFEWVAVGIISSENLLSAGVTTSPVLLFVLVALFPLALITWPFLKITLISRRQPFNRLDFASLILSTLLALSMLSLLLVDGLFVANVRAQVDGQLEELATKIDETFRLEVRDAFRQLVALDESPDFEALGTMSFEEYREAPGTPEAPAEDRPETGATQGADRSAEAAGGEGDGAPAAGAPDSGEPAGETVDPGTVEADAQSFIRSHVERYLAEQDLLPLVYPYFDAMLWPNSTGDLSGAHLPMVEHAVLPQNIRDRAYFRCARAWTDPVVLRFDDDHDEAYAERIGAERARGSEGEDAELCLEPILDRASGRPAVALAVLRAAEGVPASGDDGGEGSGPGEDRPVAALITRLASLSNPVLPPQYAFAIVEDSGRVLFHSDPRRAHTEDFANATDENRLLQSMLDRGREGSVPMHYWGRRHRAYVRPVHGLPWSVVVFRSLEDVRLRNFELLYDFLNPFLLVLLTVLLAAAAFKLVTPRKFRAYLWPTTRNLPAYRSIVAWTLLVLLGFFVMFLLGNRIGYAWIFYASLLVVPATILLVVFGLPWLHRKGGRELSRYDRLMARLRPGSGRSAEGSGTEEDAEPFAAEAAPRARRRRSGPRTKTVAVVTVALVGLGIGTAFVAGADILLLWLGTAFTALACARWWLRGELHGERRRRAYILALGCLLLISVLPCVGFLHLASARQVQFLVQDTQRDLALAKEAREEEIRALEGPLSQVYEDDRYDYQEVLDHDRAQGLESLFATELAGPEEGASRDSGAALPIWPYGDEDLEGWWSRRMYGLFSARPIPLNDLSPTPAGIDLSRFGASVGTWVRRERDGVERIELTTDGSDGNDETRLSSRFPTTGTRASLGFLASLGLAGGLVLLLAAPFVFSWFIAEKLLLVSLVYLGKNPEGSGRRSPNARPGQSIPEVLSEARRQGGVVKRLVVVAGQLDREAWKVTVTPEGDGVAPYCEVSFRDAWKKALATGPTSGEGGEASGETKDEGSETGDSAAPFASRAKVFKESLVAGAEDGQYLLLVDFEPDLRDPAIAADQTHALRELIECDGRSVVIITDVLPARPTAEAAEASDEETVARRRWRVFFGSFPVRHARYDQDLQGFLARVNNYVEALDALLERAERGETQAEPGHVRHWRKVVRRIGKECEHTATLRDIGRHLLRELVGEVEKKDDGPAELQPAWRTDAGDSDQARYVDLVTEQHVIARIEAEARLHYRYFWSRATIDEKLAIYQLARYGLVNPKYFAWVLDLVQRGLVVRSPDLRLMNRSFRSFVLDEVDRARILKWSEEAGPSAWGLLKWIIPFPLLFLAGFLFITQRDAVSNAAGVLVALASLAPVLFNLYGKFQEVNLRRTEPGDTG